MPLILSSQSMNSQVFLQEIENDLGLSTAASTKNWVNENKGFIESQLEEYGAVLFSLTQSFAEAGVDSPKSFSISCKKT